jgi:hypothetical protein
MLHGESLKKNVLCRQNQTVYSSNFVLLPRCMLGCTPSTLHSRDYASAKDRYVSVLAHIAGVRSIRLLDSLLFVLRAVAA